MLNFLSEEIVFQEVPDEVSLSYLITGCPLRCKGCHSKDSWNKNLGTALTANYLEERIKNYQGLISCLLFMGGEWEADYLEQLLIIGKKNGLKTCLYTGLELEEVPKNLIKHLDFLKTGRWIEHLGGLDSPTTNQRFFKLAMSNE